MEDKTAFITAIVAVLISIGVPVMDNTIGQGLDELQDFYICSVTQDIQEFKGGLSSTAYTGYPYENSRKGYIRCNLGDTKGEWIQLSEYASSLGIDPYDLLVEKETQPQPSYAAGVWGNSIICTQDKGCR